MSARSTHDGYKGEINPTKSCRLWATNTTKSLLGITYVLLSAFMGWWNGLGRAGVPADFILG